MNDGMHKRPSCLSCLRPLKTCVCKHIQIVENETQLVILQHSLEVTEAKNTGRLLHLCLKNSQIFEGETFGDSFLKIMQTDRFRDLLLYPEDQEASISNNAPIAEDYDANERRSGDSQEPLPYRLWVLDATWRKSRKMLYLNPFLQRMPRLSLDNCPSSLYTIRKAHKENQLSTLEASCYALQKLEANRVDYSPVLNAFAAFVAEQHTFLPSST